MALPADRSPDSTLALLREGYDFIPARCRRHGSDLFATRLMLRRAICMQGAEAARIFYSGGRFTRVGAMPVSVLKLLQDHGSVQLLDGDAHRHRKALFLSLMTPDSAARLGALTEAGCLRRLERTEGDVVLFDVMRAVLGRAACAWAGVPLPEAEAEARIRALSEMIESGGSFGPRNWRALLLRARCERWARRLVQQARREAAASDGSTPLHMLATHRDSDGALLPVKHAAVELLNLLRPIVAVARFVVFAALFLHRHPQARARIAAGDDAYLAAFVQEVRRLSPFFPFIGGRVRTAFAWRGHLFDKGAWVLLDLYGTNRDPRSWEDPEAFRPERLLARPPGPFDLVPQGGGDARQDHRCPGEPLTLEVMQVAVRLLTRRLTYEVPEQDLSVDLSHVPALPASGFRMRNVRRV